MQKRKKNGNKQNKAIKRVPLGTVPSLNYTEQIRLATYQSTELKQMMRSIDMRKPPASSHPYKKTVSRKSLSKSVKQNPQYQPPKLKYLMKQFKELKLLHENQRSKSRSPVSCKSRSLQRQFPKKLSHHTLNTKPNSEVNLTLKLDRTIKKLNQSNFFREEDSMLPLSSSSDIPEERKQGQIFLTEQDEIVDMSELRKFQSTKSIRFKKAEGMAFKTYLIFKQTMSAIRIQRAWRRYQTKRLIQRYVFLSEQQRDLSISVKVPLPSYQYPPQVEQFPGSSPENKPQKSEIMFCPEQYFGREVQENGRPKKQKVRHISNLEASESGSSEYEQIVKKMKIEELQKWNQIISIISVSKNESPQQLERLLQKLTEQSQLNKKELEQKTKEIMANSRRMSPEKEPQQNLHDKQEQKLEVSEDYPEEKPAPFHSRNQSSSSQALEEYDSKKYIDYLDGDVYPQGHQGKKEISSLTISKHQQELLLSSLEEKQNCFQIGMNSLCHSESVENLDGGKQRKEIRRSTSQKMLRRSLSQMSEESIQDQGQINLDILTQQFLQGSDPHSQNLDILYSEQKLRQKLAELNSFKDGVDEGPEYQPINAKQKFIYGDEDEDSERVGLQRSRPAGQLHQRSIQEEIRIQEGEQSPQMKVQVVEEVLQSDSDEAVSEGQNQKLETISTIIMNNLVMDLLKEIACSDSMTQAFKTFTLASKPRVRRAETTKKKKGFPTSKAQIELFVQGLIKYLRREEMHVFRNLQVPTGPSALEMLRYMHQYEQSEPQSESGDEDQSNVMVVPNRVFDSFWGIKEKSIIIEIPSNYDETNSLVFKHQFQLLKSFNKIFYRSLFDTFNECLDCQRNFGQYGRPFPWKRASNFMHSKGERSIEESIRKASRRMVDLSTTYCGLIIEKEEMSSISEEYVQQVREDRLSRMLAGDLVDGEERWVFYDDEETEILVQISNAVYTELLIQVIEALYELY